MNQSTVSGDADIVFRARSASLSGRVVSRRWRIVRRFDTPPPPHAQIQALDVPSLLKTVAVAALLDDRLYIRERSSG